MQKLIAASALALILAGCGGGGADTGAASSLSSASGNPVSAPASNSKPSAANDDASTASSRALAARFNNPDGIAVDAQGNLFVADRRNFTIRQITPDGRVLTLAGRAGVAGSNDGAGSAATFTNPRGIAIDSGGNLYVTDMHAVRKVSPQGVVTTLAGAVAASGDADGAGSAARFNFPHGLAVDGGGNVLVADAENYLIRRIAPDGAVSTVAGSRGLRGRSDGPAGSASLIGPHGIDVASNGDIYFTDWLGPPAQNIPEGSALLRKVSSQTGTVSTVLGNYRSDTGPALFSNAFALTVDAADNIYLVNDELTIHRITPSGQHQQVGGPFAVAQPIGGITIDRSGKLFITGSGTHTVASVDASGSATLVAGKVNESGSVDVAQ
ncbi:NHL repeat-containing protein [Noviherbaspirillum humi]|uniref:NHL repeat-containing protein n=1 Tax=Noviherbaspirillum humi TaxID=1688639 RepID=A0A239EC97_9BURK|nr:alkaline phosphatase PhoX [Noviherbaspirillum humi]SNS41888.1 NHL repeat-containing protein [Noviherbaspirillum humi]